NAKAIISSLPRELRVDVQPLNFVKDARNLIRLLESSKATGETSQTIEHAKSLSELFQETRDCAKSAQYADDVIGFAKGNKRIHLPSFVGAQLCVGRALIGLEQFDGAIRRLASKESKSTFINEIQFELGLTYLKKWIQLRLFFEKLLRETPNLAKSEKFNVCMNIGITSRYNENYDFFKALKLAMGYT
ncbi:hypothetical protein BC829DRAFT_388954, partial [Chytridium lagenaria]